MKKNMKCQDCEHIFTANTENVNEVGMVLDVNCPQCDSYEVDIENDTIEQILPPHLRWFLKNC